MTKKVHDPEAAIGGETRQVLEFRRLPELGTKERWAGTMQTARCAGWLGKRREHLKELYLDAAALGAR